MVRRLVIDVVANERQFIDHLAPVWHALPGGVRGTFVVDPPLIDHARTRGIEAEPRAPLALHRGGSIAPNVGADRPALVASYGDIKEARRFGYGPLAFIEHGAGQSYGSFNPASGSYAGGLDRADNELILVPNAACARTWQEAYPDARVEVVGCPRLDGLPRRVPGPGPVVALSFHGPWPSAPYGGNAWADFSPVIDRVRDRFTTIGHAHPGQGWGEKMARTYAKRGIPFVEDFDDVCRQADVYVCDNSSTLPEFASTGRPVVLLNARHWHRKGGVGGRFWDWAHLGVNVDRPEDLLDGIAEALADAPERQAAREDALGLVYGVREGGAALAATAIVSWLRGRVEVAA
jgi:hypothetical protein